jgi:hypothetical protein
MNYSQGPAAYVGGLSNEATKKEQAITPALELALSRLYSRADHLEGIYSRIVGPSPASPQENQPPPNLGDLPTRINQVIDRIEKISAAIDSRLF